MFKDNLKRIMAEKGVSPAELSRITGISKASLSQYLAGKNKPSAKRIIQMAEALEVDPDDLVRTPKRPYLEELSGDDRIYNLKPDDAARLMGVHVNFIRDGLRNGIFPWGYAIEHDTKWSYFINSKKFARIEEISLQAPKEETP